MYTSQLATVSTGANFSTVYGKTFEWENFCGCLTPCCRVLHETYRICYSTKIRGKIFAIECKIMKTAKFSHSKVLPYTVVENTMLQIKSYKLC